MKSAANVVLVPFILLLIIIFIVIYRLHFMLILCGYHTM